MEWWVDGIILSMRLVLNILIGEYKPPIGRFYVTRSPYESLLTDSAWNSHWKRKTDITMWECSSLAMMTSVPAPRLRVSTLLETMT